MPTMKLVARTEKKKGTPSKPEMLQERRAKKPLRSQRPRVVDFAASSSRKKLRSVLSNSK
jgi:hypothetical protein